MEAYRNAMLYNRKAFEGKTVSDPMKCGRFEAEVVASDRSGVMFLLAPRRGLT